MKYKSVLVSAGSLLLLGGCGFFGGNNPGQTAGGSQSSVLGKLRPKSDPELIAQLKREQMMTQGQPGQDGQQNNTDAQGRYLPNVSQDPFSAAFSGAPQNGDTNLGKNEQQNQTVPDSKPSEANPFEGAGDSSPAEAATYGQYNGFGGGGVPAPPPGAVAGGLVPPPPAAVTLSTQANVAYGDPSTNPYMNPYANPALNPYGIPMQFQQMPQQGEQQRPSGLFGSGNSDKGNKKSSSSDDDEEKEKKEKENFVPIQPTGMPSRSQYKQRDDLKVLWNGAIATEQYQNLIEADGDLENRLKQVNVGLPPDSTKGIFSVTPRVVTSVFKPTDMGKKSTDKVQKMQADMVQSYYRYLFEYNKFALAQQTVAARKQEVEVASSRSEKQRAAADLSSAQNEADSAKEDLNTAQYELAANAGARAACSIIGKVSGVTPPVATLAQAEKSANSEVVKKKSGMFSAIGLGGLFGHKDKEEAKGDDDDDNARAEAPAKEVKEKPAKVAKADKDKQTSKKKSKSDDGDDDLAPSSAPEKIKIASKPVSIQKEAAPEPKVSKSPISFDLKDIDITARKSILTVSVRNTGSDDFKISPDDISLAEGNKRISDASLRSEFDSLTVKPNEEVKGKITILGKPWNDRLTVNLSDGTVTVSLKRRN